jgi:putative heme-binding domain-containing protein
MRIGLPSALLATVLSTTALPALGNSCQVSQQLDEELRRASVEQLVAQARRLGDARRGAVVFYQKTTNCIRCHLPDATSHRLGPDLTKWSVREKVTDGHLVESILEPSKSIRKGFETVVLETADDVVTGFLVSANDTTVVIRDAAKNYKEVKFDRGRLKNFDTGAVSLMPQGLANMLTSRQQFLDLVKYLIAIRDGGRERARELEPDPSLYADRPLPEYEKDVDHRRLIAGLDRAAFRRGKKTYERLCINCHGTRHQPGSLPTSLAFGTGRFKNGSDPFKMYQTLTRGFGMMNAQTWMVPSQKYDVIHYIRKEYLERHNPSQFFAVTDAYLAGLPKGTSRGPAPSALAPWEQMDYGPNQVMTLEIGEDATNFAYKGNAIRLDSGPGGVSQGGYWMVYDYDTMRVAAAWSGDGFIDWNSIHFNGKHAVHPRLVGDVKIANPTGPGWGRPADGSFVDTRLVGRDKRLYGPLPRAWAQYEGMYGHGPKTLIEYTVGNARVLEMPGVATHAAEPVFSRSFEIGARDADLILQVAHSHAVTATLEKTSSAVMFGAGAVTMPSPVDASRLNGATRLDVVKTAGLHAGAGDFTVTARIKTRKDGTILAQTGDSLTWMPNGLTWFIRGGKLHVDIGWVGQFGGRRRVANGKWHHVAFSYRAASGEIRFYIDGKAEERAGSLKRKSSIEKPVVRIGFTSNNFPGESFFDGHMSEVRFYNSVLGPEHIGALSRGANPGATAAAHWDLTSVDGDVVRDKVSSARDARVTMGRVKRGSGRASGFTVAGVVGDVEAFEWVAEKRDLRLRIPVGKDRLRFTLWFAAAANRKLAKAVADAVVIDEPRQDLRSKTRGGPSRWPHVLKSEAIVAADDGPFAVDVLKRPTDNPWFCRMRLTGFDFTDDGDVAIVSAWDGSIWKVSGLGELPETNARGGTRTVTLSWRRIASGLFQPLGVKIVDGKVYVTCRDQICILHDLNGDEEIDWIECFNNDHQVTDHFHEFAMGLQVDDEGNFYYAKSARHAKTALVPHHGTLLKVSRDGSKTEIIANGFRAANGVCLNPDGTFIVTDQEGHWNPKNRINYVKKGGFYGNMYGYHDVTDSSDEAMEQPLVWITNSFDRSPGELLWVDSKKWGPLDKRLLNLSYGYGTVYIVPHEEVNGQQQGGMCAFPIPRFPTGVMRGRFHPRDGQLYLAGMFAWAGSQTQPGGLYRLRYTGKPVHLPVELHATRNGMTITFSGLLDAKSAADVTNYRIKSWDLRRTKSYGSKHYNEKPLAVASARLGSDGRTVHLGIPDVAKTWCMEIDYRVRSAAGHAIKGRIHNTIHHLKD